jgi:hypothetical protein
MAKESQGIICYWATVTVNATLAANVVGELTGFSGPNMSAGVIDVTNLQSTAKEKMIGLYDGGQISLNVNWVATNDGQIKLRESLVKRTKGSLLIQLSTATTAQKISLEGYVIGMNVNGAVDNVLKGDFSIAITGGASFTTG